MFFKNKVRLLTVLISLGLILAVLWFCLFRNSESEVKDGTLVDQQNQKEVHLCQTAA